ncbi:MAG: DUF4139 domain-containing protein [Candidatus Marinimicrobia bacterium]|jgi:hypothetical protein|nr:DUF4139 domain-containing protein [Candidatus Neomarinimicrobiota bacterium]
MKKAVLILILYSAVIPQSRNADLTLYKDGYGLVKQPVGGYRFKSGINVVKYDGIPDQMERNSPFLFFEGAEVYFQSYNYDVFTSSSYLKDHLGQQVTVTPSVGKPYQGTLLDLEGNWLTVTKKDMVKMFNSEEVVSISLANGKSIGALKPELTWKVNSPDSNLVSGRLTYVTKGLDWDAIYRFVINTEETSGRLKSSAMVHNKTSLSYENANLTLIEGKLHRVSKSEPPRPEVHRMAKADAGAPSFEAAELGDYEVYGLNQSISLPKNESVTVDFRPEKNTKFERTYLFENRERASAEEPLMVELSFPNETGGTIPAGLFQIYQTGSDGSLEFIGEDKLNQIPNGEEAEVIAGRANKVRGERKVINYERLTKSEEAVIKIVITNDREDIVSVKVTEHIYGEWVIREPTHTYHKVDAQTIVFELKVQPGNEETISYTYKKNWK